VIRLTEFLSALEYPGRLLALGSSPGGDRAVLLYAITGRSPSSQARRLVRRDDGVWVQPTDEETLKTGRVDLLVYPAVLFAERGIAVSNGRQTADIRDGLAASGNPIVILDGALGRWDYEPDAPVFTPRISGCVAGGRAGLSLIRRGSDGVTLRSYFDVSLQAGKARLISTYAGPNRDPLPCFEGEPKDILIEAQSARETAEAAYAALKPRAAGQDFRVAAACVTLNPRAPKDRDVHIINRHERT
jgi:IMP cyclohydrolase